MTIRKWDYRVERFAETSGGWVWRSTALEETSFEEGLQLVGSEGWELVASMGEVNEGRTVSSEYIFKREA